MRKNILRDCGGTTLVEVMAAIGILAVASGIIMGSILFCTRLDVRRKEVQDAVSGIGEMIHESRNGTEAVLKLSADDLSVPEESGAVYADGEISVFWTEGSFHRDFYRESGLEELPELTEKTASAGLPEVFPDLRDRTDEGFMEEMEDYWKQEEDGSPVFSEEDGGPASWAELDGLTMEKEGSWTASGAAVFDIPAGITFRADGIRLRMKAEIYRLAGTLTCVYPETYRGNSLPVSWCLDPESGHGQPALIFVEEGTAVAYRYTDRSGEEHADEDRESFEIPSGWYQTDGRNLLEMTAGDWKQCRLEKGNGNSAGEIRKAAARLSLAGLLDREAENE